ALILECNAAGCRELRATLPPHVVLCASAANIPAGTQLLIAVTPRIFEVAVPEVIYFRPPVLTLGVGCRRDASVDGVAEEIDRTLSADYSLSPLSVGAVATIDMKRDEALVAHLCRHYGIESPIIYTAEELKDIEVPNPSEKPLEITGVAGVAEACAMKAASSSSLLVEKQKRVTYTFAVATRRGHIEIVGAGPGDPKLVSVRGREFLQNADLILYAGSLVPVALTECAREGAVVRSSASMSLDEQFALMKEFYDRGCLVVRLHTGDPCIYGAIQEQMALFDRYGMSYHITPGISAFQAAAAELRSQFTIPERVQSIILTRDEGRTPVPSRERISELARSQSTMCIYLSADLVEHLQAELLTSYPPSTPVAVCYKLTWPQQRIFRGQLHELTSLVRDNGLKLTTLIVVGDAIDNREGLSKLYDAAFSHLFRQ
ncbi:MAG: precorrin-4 C(11)-methyltransferase, partial [Muribaculum sp.]|nr:precorrin-4 C(11)-methyltransferase [Muribaculum sp.]